MRKFKLRLLPGLYTILQLQNDSGLCDYLSLKPFLSITRTGDEISVVCRQEDVPTGFNGKASMDWRALEVAGPLRFDESAVLSTLLQPLAMAGISVFTISTYNTDYIFVSKSAIALTVATLQNSGHEIQVNSE